MLGVHDPINQIRVYGITKYSEYDLRIRQSKLLVEGKFGDGESDVVADDAENRHSCGPFMYQRIWRTGVT